MQVMSSFFTLPSPLLLPLPLPLGSSFSTSPPPTSMASFCVLTPWFSMATYQCYTSNKGLITHTFLGSGGVSWAPPPPTMACPALTDLEQTTTTVSSWVQWCHCAWKTPLKCASHFLALAFFLSPFLWCSWSLKAVTELFPEDHPVQKLFSLGLWEGIFVPEEEVPDGRGCKQHP